MKKIRNIFFRFYMYMFEGLMIDHVVVSNPTITNKIGTCAYIRQRRQLNLWVKIAVLLIFVCGIKAEVDFYINVMLSRFD